MNPETSDKELSFEENLRKVKSLTSSFRKTLEKHSSAGHLLSETTEKDLAKYNSDPFISGKDLSVKEHQVENLMNSQVNKNIEKFLNEDNFRRSHTSLDRICSKVIEEETCHSKKGNVLEDFYDGDSQPFLNLKTCGEKRVLGISREDKMQMKNSRTAISGCSENGANNGVGVKDFIETERTTVDGNEKELETIKRVTNSKLDISNLLLEDRNEIFAYDDLSEYNDNEEQKPQNFIMVDIYRKIAYFFEIYLVSPVATITESYLDILEFALAMAVCTAHMYYTNAKSKLVNSNKKNKNSQHKKVVLPLNRRFELKDSIKNSSFLVKDRESQSFESLITLSSGSNSKEEISNTSHRTQNGFHRNISSDKSVRFQFVEDCANFKHKNENIIVPEDKREQVSSENKNSKLVATDKICSNSLKDAMQSEYFQAKIEQVAKDNNMSPIVDIYVTDDKLLKEDEIQKLYFPSPLNEHFKEDSILELKRESLQHSANVFENNSNIPQYQLKKKYSVEINMEKVDIPIKEIKEHPTEDEYLVSPTIGIDKTENIAIPIGERTFSDISLLSNECFQEARLLDFEPFQHSSEICSGDIESKHELEETHPNVITNIDIDIFSANFKSEEKSVQIGKDFLTSSLCDIYSKDEIFNVEHKNSKIILNDYLKEISDLDLNVQQVQRTSNEVHDCPKHVLFEFENDFSDSFSEYHRENLKENKNEKYALSALSVEEHSIYDPEDSIHTIFYDSISSAEYPDINTTAAPESITLLDTSPEILPDIYNRVNNTVKVTEIVEGTDTSIGDISAIECSNSMLRSETENSIERNDYANDDIYQSQQRENEVRIEDSFIERFNEDFTIEEDLSEDNATEDSSSDSEYDVSEEYQTTFTRYIVVEDDENDENALKVNDSHLHQLHTLKSNEVESLTEEGFLNETNCSCDMCFIELVDTEDRNVLHGQHDIITSSKDLEQSDDMLNVSLEVNGSAPSLQSLISSEEYPYDSESRNCDIIEISQEKFLHFSQALSSSMPNVRDINGLEFLSYSKKEMWWKCHQQSESSPNTYEYLKLDGSRQRLIETSCSRQANEEWKTRGCFQDLPDIVFPISDNRFEEYPSEDLQCSLSFVSEPFEVAESTSSRNTTEEFAPEVKADRKKHKKQNSFKSKVSSVFNGMKKLRGRFANAASEVGSSYRKYKNAHSNSF